MWHKAEEESVKNRDNIAITVRALLLVLVIMLLSNAASAVDVTYRFIPDTGTTVDTGITTNYGACGANPTTGPRYSLLTNAASTGCSASSVSGGSGTVIDLWYNTAYSADTLVTGQYYQGRVQATAGTTAFTYTATLMYELGGTITLFSGTAGSWTSPASTYNTDVNFSLTGMTPTTVPTGAKLGLRLTKSGTQTTRKFWFGDAGDVALTGPSGYFAVTETSSGGGSATYNLSGYITNKSSGLPLNGATVQTNTSLSTTSNATGFYNFTGLSNGTYIVNASLAGYVTNSTNVTVSGADVTNANISLSPVGVNPPNITSWGNNQTNDQSTSISININVSVRFNATANQTITTWNWYKNDTNQNNNYDNFTTSWNATGSYHIDVNATNANGTSNTITWNITVAAPPTYNISGYVTNKSSGLPLNGATVQTNTSLTTTTNVSGFYNFTGLSNGTYMINASLAGYANNSITVTISGADNTTANISLTPVLVPTYQLSGYVTNATSGAAISGATVTTNTSLSTTTNAAGFYNFTVSNGTYLITASMVGYSANSTTRTVNGAAVSNVNISLTPTPSVPPSVGKILVATNRYVILDDPIVGTAGPGFSNPGYNLNDWNYWNAIGTNKSTLINATALYLDNNGFPVNGTNITFILYNPGGGINATNYSITNAYGLASFSFDLNGSNYYGRWNVSVTNGSFGANYTFIYNWWGCGTSSTSCNIAHSGASGGQNPDRATITSANSPYLKGRDQITTYDPSHVAWNCTQCHQSFDGMPGGNFDGGVNRTNNASDVHRNISCTNAGCHGDYTTHGSNMVIASCYNSGCHTPANRSDISNKSTLNSANVATALSEYSINSTDFNATFHTPNSTVPCIICHGPMHNITKPDKTQRFIRNTNTEDSQCKTCHSSYNEHNSSNTTSGGVNCTLCHSDDVHAIKVFAQNATYVDLNHDNPNPARGNCTNCHQNASFFAALEAQPKAGNYTGRDPPIIPVPLNHSTDPLSGALWNGSNSSYWDNTSQKTACYYCHGLSTLHSSSALGNINNVKGTNNLNQDLTTSRWCANCHYKTAPDYGGDHFTPQPPEILNQSGLVPAKSNDGTTFTNHSAYFSSGYNDSVCKNCHNNNLAASATSLNFSHNVAIGSGGAPNCIQCHNLATGLSGGAPVGVNFTAANLSVHNGTNSQNATQQGYAPIIGACWACHDTDGNVTSGHPDRYKTPKTCADCHLSGGTYYNQSQNWGGLTVTEHYYSGSQIKAGNSSSNITSCINCHENVSEMIVYNNDTNYGSFTGDGVRLTGGNMSFYHYGANRSDIRSWDSGKAANCSYCHQNASTAFNRTMVNENNKSIQNHSQSSSPNCFNTNCHASGWLHNSTLTKPAFILPNSSLCLSCHGTGSGNASITNLSQHNGTVNCTSCHLNSARNIHPVQYLQPDASFKDNSPTNKSTAVNCTNCHQNTGVTGFNAPIIPDPLKHSSNLTNGTIWGNYWNTQTSSSCYYCHNDTKHNSTALGDVSRLLLDSNNTKKGSLATTTWCIDCHYNISNSNYKGSLWAPSPPLITVNNTGKNNWENHSSYLSSGIKDSNCESCHALNGSYVTNSLNYTHSLNEGAAGGPNCISCHNLATGLSGGAPVGVNFTAANLSVHNGTNSQNATQQGYAPIIGACWACHDTDGNVTSGHPDRYKTPKTCADCHLSGGTYYNQSQNWGGLTVSEHYYSGSQIKAGNSSSSISSCINCHENVSEMIVYNNDTNYGSFTGDGVRLTGGNMSFYHYGRDRTDLRSWDSGKATNCSYCHQNASTTFSTAMLNAAYNATINNHSSSAASPSCYNSTCHNSGFIHNSTLTRPSLPLPNTTYCSTCHAAKQEHNGTQQCSKCHINTSSDDTIHPIKYVQTNGTYNTNSSSAANCTSCHQSGITGFNAPLIPSILKHSANASNGTIWGNYWNTQTSSSCYYCHNDTKHNSTALGDVSRLLLDSNNTKKGSLATTTWCIDCHYNISNSNYKGSLWAPSPPLITVNNTGKNNWENHSSYLSSGIKDSNCESCHALNGSYVTNSLNYTHSLNEGAAGGPNCISCHNLATSLSGGAPVGVNFTAFNNSVHFGMNSVNSSANGACWACHDSDGNVTSGHPDRYKTPKTCTDCHLGTGTYNASAYNALIVSEHYHSGTDIKAGNSTSNIASCINCHENVSEMIVYNNDTNYGSFPGDGVRLTGGNMSAYHYGNPRTDLRVGSGSRESNCLYCHQNLSTSFAGAMQNPGVNKSIYNHTDNPTQRCANCHGLNSWLHNATMTIPNGGVLDNGYCQTCHVSGTGGARPIPETHNGISVNCWNCHQDPNTTANPMYKAPIHGMMYAQTNGSYQRFVKGTPANCTTCHINNLVNTTPYTAIRIPALNHSVDTYSGMKWNGTQTRFWDNTSMITACNYCHQSELHNANAALLGNVSTIQGSNQLKSSNLANSRWCAACHYNDSTSNYKGSLLPKVPPEILNRTGTVPVLASDGTAFYNHSSDVAANSNDSKCKECHGLVGSYAETTLNYSHSLNEGGGGADCVSSGCHGTAGSPTSPYMNWSSLKQGMHAKLNNGATNTTVLTDSIDKACWACHGDGTEPSGHPAKYKTPYYCADCHLASGSIAGKYSTKNATEHQHVDAQVRTNSSYARCENCHNNSLVGYSDKETNALTNYTLGNVSHYGANKTAGKLMEPSVNSTNCIYCHLNNSNRQNWANATNASATKPDIHGNYNVTTASSVCWGCHVDGGASGVTAGFTLHNTSLNPGASEFCLNCHVPGGSAQRVNVSSGDLGMHVDLNQSNGTGILNNSDCWVCHFGYPQPGTSGSHSYNVNRQNTYYCEDCHGPNKNATAIPNATTKVLNAFYHGKSYFDSAPKYKDCTVCHAANDSRKDSNGNRLKIYHNQTPLGTVANPGWAGWSVGSVPGCNDCHQTRNINDAPFHAPGKDHYVSASGGCTKNCHKGDLNSNVHRQYLFGDIQKVYGITPPVILSVTLNTPVFPGVDVNITAHGQDNGNQIEAARYRVVNSSGAEVIGWTYMTPQDNKFKSRSEIAKGSINTSTLTSGNYAVYIQIMASGPRADQTKRAYPYNGAWSSPTSTGFTVI